MDTTYQESFEKFFATVDFANLRVDLSAKVHWLSKLEEVVADCRKICTFHRSMIESRYYYFSTGDIERIKRGISLFELCNAFALSGRTQYFDILTIPDDNDFEQTIKMRWLEHKFFQKDMEKLKSLGYTFKVIDHERAKRSNFVKMMKRTFPFKP